MLAGLELRLFLAPGEVSSDPGPEWIPGKRDSWARSSRDVPRSHPWSPTQGATDRCRRHYKGLPSITALAACSGMQLGSDKMLVEVLSWRREFRTAGETQRDRCLLGLRSQEDRAGLVWPWGQVGQVSLG